MNKYIKINKKLNKKSKRVGRGTSSGKGKTSGRGQKGQKARSGGKIPYLGFEGGQMPLYKRIPKKGFTSKNKKEIQIINLNDLKNFDSSEVTVESLKLRGLIKKNSKIVKLLGEGDIDKTLIVKLHLISKSAKEKLENKGGSFEKIS